MCLKRKFLKYIIFSLVILFSTAPNKTYASNICLSYTSRYNELNGFPKNLLSAIASVESGKNFSSTQNFKTPWPWTINTNGKGYFFKTRSAAIRKVKYLLKQGIRNIDVGCMQVNLFYHPNAFRNLKEAFNPNTNIEYAARFLKKLHKTKGNWNDAIGSYHSGQKERKEKYLKKVNNTLKLIEISL